jgi:O-acetylserine/cysteine efflux transporter
MTAAAAVGRQPTHIRPAHLLLLLAINLAWAANNVAVKEAVIAMPPLAAAALRFALVALFCLPWLRWVPGRMGPILAVALFQGALHFACLNLAYAAADNVAALALVGQAGVPFALLLAVLVLGERIALIRSIAIAVCLVGVAIIGFDPAVVDEIEGAALVVLASFWYAVSTIFLKRITGIHHFTILAWLGLVASATLAVASLLAEPGAIAAMGSHAPIAYAAVGFSALFSSMLGHGGANALIQRYPVSWIMPLFIPAPVLAAALGAWVYDLPVTWRLVVGGGLAVAGAAVITLRTARPRATGDA